MPRILPMSDDDAYFWAHRAEFSARARKAPDQLQAVMQLAPGRRSTSRSPLLRRLFSWGQS